MKHANKNQKDRCEAAQGRQRRLYFFCLELLRDPKHAGQIAKEVLSASRKSKTTASEEDFLAAALQHCDAFYRVYDPQDFREFADSEPQQEEPDIPENLKDAEGSEADFSKIEAEHQRILQLPYRLRSAIVCREFAKMSIGRYAQAEEISERAAEHRIGAAMQRLYKEAKLTLPVSFILQEMEKRTAVPTDVSEMLRPPHKKKIVVGAACVLIAAALGTGIYFAVRQRGIGNQRTDALAAPTPTATPKTKPPKTTVRPAATQAPSSPEKTDALQAAVSPVLSKLKYADGSYISFQYDSNHMIVAVDQYGNRIFSMLFDESGNKVSQTQYAPDHKGYRNWTFDKTGAVTELSTSFAEILRTTYRFEYAKDGALLKKTLQPENSDKSTFEYYTNGQIKKQTIRKTGNPTQEYMYDKAGKLTSCKQYDENTLRGDILQSETFYEYDSFGAIRKTIYQTYEETGENINFVCGEEYDAFGNKIKTVTDTKDGTITTLVYTYDAVSNCILTEETKVYKYTDIYSIGILGAEDTVFWYNTDGSPFPICRFGQSEDGYTVTQGEYTFQIGDHYEDQFDGNGNLVRRSYIFPNGGSYYWYSCEYDENNRKIKDTFQYANSGDEKEVYFDCRYSYDNDGNVTQVLDDSKGSKYLFDPQGRIVQYEKNETLLKFRYDATGKMIEKSHRFLTLNNEMTVTEQYDAEGALLQRIVRDPVRKIWYDQNRRPVREVISGTDGLVASDIRYEYNRNGTVAARLRYDKDGTLQFQTKYQYDSGNQLESWVRVDASGNPIFQYTYQYDAQGNRTAESAQNSQGVLEYNERGELTKWTAYDSLGRQFEAEFARIDKNADTLFKNCKITDLIPEFRSFNLISP